MKKDNDKVDVEGSTEHAPRMTNSICDEIVEGRFLAMASRRKAEMKERETVAGDANQKILERIRSVLQGGDVDFREVEHEATHTSEESAKARGEDLKTGAKALLVKIDNGFKLFVLPADRKLDSAAVKRALGAKKLRFATAEELKELTGLVPGSVPPFGNPILSFELYADESVGKEVDKVAFNAGSLTNSIVMKASDWDAIAKPQRFAFAK